MTIFIDDNRAHVSATSHAQYFYFYMALSCIAVAFLGFAPTYFVPMAAGKLPPMPVVHFHGLLFFAWTLYFAEMTGALDELPDELPKEFVADAEHRAEGPIPATFSEPDLGPGPADDAARAVAEQVRRIVLRR